MASSFDQPNGIEAIAAPVEGLIVIDEVVESTVTEPKAEDSDDDIQIIGEFQKPASNKPLKRTLNERVLGNSSTSSSTEAKRQKIDEVQFTTTMQEVEISEPQPDSPEIAENEADFICNIRREESFVVSKKKRGHHTR
jgi:hypothetical protein